MRRDDFDKPIHIALKKGYNEIAKYLVDNGADVNSDSESGLPLNIVARKGDLRMLNFLISKGARVNETHLGLCGSDETPLQSAVKKDRYTIVERLLAEKADIVFENNGDHPLFIAIMKKNLTMVQLLIEKSKLTEKNLISDFSTEMMVEDGTIKNYLYKN